MNDNIMCKSVRNTYISGKLMPISVVNCARFSGQGMSMSAINCDHSIFMSKTSKFMCG